jgi:hypothetical protein
MTASGRLAAALALVLLAGCQPLPHPFANDRPPASLLTMRDSIGVSIAPIVGPPRQTAEKLGAALASALLQREIPASDRTTSRASYLLYGRIDKVYRAPGRITLVANWQLRDAAGHPVGERSARLEAAAGEWETGDDGIVARLAAASAEVLAPLLEDEAPIQAAAGGRIRIAIRPLSGAPGDGGQSLAKAVALVLGRQDLAIVADPNGAADLYLEGEVSVSPITPDKQHVKILWRVRRADGAEIGTVGQENDLPRGLLDGAWGDVAYSVAIAAADGLMELIARGAPERKS